MKIPNGQKVFVGVATGVILFSSLLFFFPGFPEKGTRSAELKAQIIGSENPVPSSGELQIIPRTTSKAQTQRNARNSVPEEIWQVVYLGEHRIGYSRLQFQTVIVNGQKRIRATSELKMRLLRFGETTKISVRNESLETETGDLLSFRSESQRGPNKSRVTGRVVGRRILVETTHGNQKSQQSYPWKSGVKSPTYQDRFLRSVPLKPGEIRHFDTFIPETGKISTIRLFAEKYRTVSLQNGQRKKLLRVRVSQAATPKDGIDVYLDEHGIPVKTESELTGNTKLIHYSVSQEKALQAIAGEELDLGISTLIPAPMIVNVHQRRKIVYRFQSFEKELEKIIPAGATQKLTKIDVNTVELTVSSVIMPRRIVHRQIDKKFTAASKFLQSTHRAVRTHAERAAGHFSDVGHIALAMESYVFRTIKQKNFSTLMATAAEVAQKMQGDCTEHAVLLAAMLRTRKIPSRVVTGLVYVPERSSFGAHMWTEAWISGQWIPLDATLGEGGIGPGHIKLADSSLSDQSPAPIALFRPLMDLIGRCHIDVLSIDGKQFPTK